MKECSQVRIRNIDFQCCFSARYDSKTKSLVVETLRATHAEVVYGATGTLVYSMGYNQVWFGTYDRYFINNRGNVEKHGGFYGFGVMDRYPCQSDINFEIEGYPE